MRNTNELILSAEQVDIPRHWLRGAAAVQAIQEQKRAQRKPRNAIQHNASNMHITRTLESIKGSGGGKEPDDPRSDVRGGEDESTDKGATIHQHVVG